MLRACVLSIKAQLTCWSALSAPRILSEFLTTNSQAHDSRDGEGTPPGMVLVGPCLERRPRVTQEAKAE